MSVVFCSVMGRRSALKKKEKRQLQKKLKKQKFKAQWETSPMKKRKRFTSSSLGSPTWPPPSPSSSINNDYTTEDPLTPIHSEETVTPIRCSEKTINSDELITMEEAELFGYDDIVHAYLSDNRDNFVTEDGSYPSKDQLLDYLSKTNLKLAEKGSTYFKKCEDLKKKLMEAKRKNQDEVERVRHFYRNMIMESNSQSATIFKAALNKK